MFCFLIWAWVYSAVFVSSPLEVQQASQTSYVKQVRHSQLPFIPSFPLNHMCFSKSSGFYLKIHGESIHFPPPLLQHHCSPSTTISCLKCIVPTKNFKNSSLNLIPLSLLPCLKVINNFTVFQVHVKTHWHGSRASHQVPLFHLFFSLSHGPHQPGFVLRTCQILPCLEYSSTPSGSPVILNNSLLFVACFSFYTIFNNICKVLIYLLVYCLSSFARLKTA